MQVIRQVAVFKYWHKILMKSVKIMHRLIYSRDYYPLLNVNLWSISVKGEEHMHMPVRSNTEGNTTLYCDCN